MTAQLFKKITEWQEVTFPGSTAKSKLIHLVDEVVEISNELNSNSSNLHEEYADAFILLMGSAKSAGMSYSDIVNAITRKHNKNLTRKWGEPNEHGVINHIKDEND